MTTVGTAEGGAIRDGSLALLFPGQGAQTPGMGAELVAAGAGAPLLAAAVAEGVDLATLVTSADAEMLRRTDRAQPALFYVGWSLAEALRAGGLRPAAVAGHSLGEWVAVAVAGALDPVEAFRLVCLRGALMAGAPPGGMAAVLGGTMEVVTAACEAATTAGTPCVVANDNAPGQVVISGTAAGVAAVQVALRAVGIRKVVPLNVGGAFHSPLMAAAAATFAARLAAVRVGDARIPVALNATGRCARAGGEVRQGLADQLAQPVRWTEVVRALRVAGVETFVECGPGTTLTGLVRRIAPEARCRSVATLAAAADLAAELAGPPDAPA